MRFHCPKKTPGQEDNLGQQCPLRIPHKMRAVLLLCSALPCAVMLAPPLGSVNLVHALWAAWGTDSTPLAGVAAAARQACTDRGFTTVRVAASPFWPSQWALFLSNETAYWEAVVPFTEALSAGGCVVVYSLFWNIFALPDLYGEPLGALVAGAQGDSSSRSFAASLRYIDAFLGQNFAKSRMVAAWELTNEFNLLFDLDQSTLCVSCGGPGSPSQRTKADNVSTDGGVALLNAWADRIRAADPLGRPISSGNGLPRPAAEHLRASYLHPGRDWTEDTFAQFKSNFADISSCCEARPTRGLRCVPAPRASALRACSMLRGYGAWSFVTGAPTHGPCCVFRRVCRMLRAACCMAAVLQCCILHFACCSGRARTSTPARTSQDGGKLEKTTPRSCGTYRPRWPRRGKC